jgi:hypothetical protein
MVPSAMYCILPTLVVKVQSLDYGSVNGTGQPAGTRLRPRRLASKASMFGASAYIPRLHALQAPQFRDK